MNSFMHAPDERVLTSTEDVLGQVARAFIGQAMPEISRDRAMQATVGQAIGAEVAKPLWIAAGVGTAFLAWYVYTESNKSRRRRRR